MKIGSLKIEGTENSAHFDFDTDKHIFSIVGVSKPENVSEFFTPVLHWLDHYYATTIKENIVHNLVVDVKLDYYNTASSKYLAGIFYKFKKWLKFIPNFKINWYYDEYDDMMLEDGKDISAAVDIPMNYIAVESN